MDKEVQNALDFQKMRKRRRWLINLKRFGILCIIVLCVFAILSINEILISEGVNRRISDITGSFGGDGFPVGIPGGEIRDIGNIGKNLAVQNETNLYIYNKKGRVISNIQSLSESSNVKTNSDTALMYKYGAEEYQLYSVSARLHSGKTDNTIISADMGASGSYLFVTTSPQYAAEVIVFDKDNRGIFKWFSSDFLITQGKISPIGDTIAVACVKTSGGKLHSQVNIFNLSLKQILTEIPVYDDLILDISFIDNERFLLLTTENLYLYDIYGREHGSFSTGGGTLIKYKVQNGTSAVVNEDMQHRIFSVNVLDNELKSIFNKDFTEKIRDIALSQKSIFVLTPGGIYEYSLLGGAETKHDIIGAGRIYCIENQLYYFTKEEIGKL